MGIVKTLTGRISVVCISSRLKKGSIAIQKYSGNFKLGNKTGKSFG